MKTYNTKKPKLSRIGGLTSFEAETIEQKCRRIVDNKEPIKDGAPEIFTERKEGVLPGMNIRTDRWEIATDAMDAVTKSYQAKREVKPTMKIVEDTENENGKTSESGA